jgi:uncharacterized protein (DUF924 family)
MQNIGLNWLAFTTISDQLMPVSQTVINYMKTIEYSFKEILSFWFEEISPERWWVNSPEFDRIIIARFGSVHRAAAQCELVDWRKSAEGRLAEIIILDQFSRNIFRGQAAAFACDGLALALAQTAIDAGADRELDVLRCAFLYMPYMHSESLIIHAQAVTLFSVEGMEDQFDFELRHKNIIDRFGRYPHRNVILGRDSTEDELNFLKEPNSSF